MPTEEALNIDQDWDFIMAMLPKGWEEKARELGALQRCRRFATAEPLLRTLLIHLADGCSLRETAVRAGLGDIAKVSDVALLKRLRSAGEWLRWMAEQLMLGWIPKQPDALLGKGLNVRLVDGSFVQEPGSTGTDWRIHYSIELPSLRCDEVLVTGPQVGESFLRFEVHEGDLFIGDRGYAHGDGIAHVVEGGGYVLVRINLISMRLIEEDETSYALLERLRTLKGTGVGDWDVSVKTSKTTIHGRICAIKKSRQAAEKARKHALYESKRKGYKTRPETLEAAAYTFVFTTLDRRFSAATILEMYRARWQIELAFKRLKSIMGLGHLKKTDMEAAKAWIHGKVLVAFLIQALLAASENFSPWGYPLQEQAMSQSMERGVPDAASA